MRKDARSDQQLVDQARRGDQTAFRALVEKYQRKVFAVALGIVRDSDDAKDLCQEAFLRAYRGLDRFDGDAQFFTWIYRIVHNLAIDHLRKQRAPALPLEGTERVIAAEDHVDINPLRKLASRRLGERIQAALATLTPAHRSVLVLREIEGLSYKEIAEVMECSIGTVMSRLFHARKNLQRELGLEREAMDLAA